MAGTTIVDTLDTEEQIEEAKECKIGRAHV